MNVVYPKSRAEWREWLSSHYETEKEVLFVFPTLASGETGVSYNDAVEEALCFGWIDGVAGRLDEGHQTRRMTPRRPGSAYSRPNIERLIWLDSQNLLVPRVREAVLPLIQAPYVFPDDILAAIREVPEAQANFERFSEPYKRIRVAYIDAARPRPDEFRKRLSNFIARTAENKLITGYGGISKYYQ